MFNFFKKNKVIQEKLSKDFLIDTYRKIIIGDQKNWVLFENGTCVILMNPEKDLSSQALALLAQYGPVHAGTPSGDFNIITLDNRNDWIVTCHHPDIINYVSPKELDTDKSDLKVGLLGRSKRDMDAKNPSIIHIEDKKV